MARWRNPLPAVRNVDSSSLRRIFQSLELWANDRIGLLESGGAQVAALNTAARSSLVPGLEIDSPQVGDVYRLRAWGLLTNTSGSSANFSMDVGLGAGTYLASAVPMGLASSANPRSFFVDVELVMVSLTSQSIGMSTVWSNSNGAAGTLEVSSGSSAFVGAGAAAATQDFTTTQSKALSLNVTMGTAATTVSAQCLGFTLTRIR